MPIGNPAEKILPEENCVRTKLYCKKESSGDNIWIGLI
jgi:hypothetical protein